MRGELSMGFTKRPGSSGFKLLGAIAIPAATRAQQVPGVVMTTVVVLIIGEHGPKTT